MQTSLFDLGAAASRDGLGLGPLGGMITRQVLGRGAWVDLLPGWLSGADALFDDLLDQVPWRAEQRQMYDRVVDVPRLLCFYGEDDPLPHAGPGLGPRGAERPLRERSWASRSPPPGCASTATAATRWPGTATPSAAARPRTPWWRSSRSARARTFRLRPRGGGATIRHRLGHGDLIVMGGSCQRTWEHAIPKTARPVGPRISVQFRPRGVR